MFSAGLHAETHQHGDMNAASDASVQQVIKGTGVVKDIDMNSKRLPFRTKQSLLWAGLQ